MVKCLDIGVYLLVWDLGLKPSTQTPSTMEMDIIHQTTRLFEGKSPIDLAKDLSLSDTDEESEVEALENISTATNTDQTGVINTQENYTNTSPDIKITLDTPEEVYITTFGLGTYKVPRKEYNTQIGYLNSIKVNNKSAQTDTKSCIDCHRHDHLVNSRWAYWIKDTKLNCVSQPKPVYQEQERLQKIIPVPSQKDNTQT